MRGRVVRLLQAVVLAALLAVVAHGIAGGLGLPQDAAVTTKVEPTPRAVDVASTPVLYLVVPRGA